MISSDISHLKSGLNEKDKEVKAILEQFEVFKTQLNSKCEISDMHKVIKLLSEYAKRAELDELYNKVTPVLEKAEEVTTSSQQEILMLRSVVGRFDEVVNEKASKFSLHSIEQQIKKLPLRSEIEQMIADINK